MRVNRDILLAAIVGAMIVGIGFVTPSFVAPRSLVGLFNDTAILIMVGLGQMTVILTRCIDLSVGANIALTGVLVSLMNAAFPEVPVPILMLAAAGIGLALGAFNGTMVWLAGIPPIVVTLGTLSIYRGLAFVASGGTSIVGRQMSPAFISVPRIEIAGLPMMSWFAIIAVIISALPCALREPGAPYAAGGNPTAAVYAGINVGKTQFVAFCISGTIAGLCGCWGLSLYHRIRRYRRRLRA